MRGLGNNNGGLAQLVERVLSMHEVGSSILPFSKISYCTNYILGKRSLQKIIILCMLTCFTQSHELRPFQAFVPYFPHVGIVIFILEALGSF